MNNDDRQKMADISAQYKVIHDLLNQVLTNQTNMTTQLDELKPLKEKFKELEGDTKELVEAWQAAGVMLGVVKWAAGIGTALLTFAGSVWVLLEKVLPHLRTPPQ